MPNTYPGCLGREGQRQPLRLNIQILFLAQPGIVNPPFFRHAGTAEAE